MDPAMLYLYASMATTIVLFLVTGIYLIIKAKRKHVKPVLFLAGLLITVSLALILYTVGDGPNVVYHLVRTGSLLFGVLFIERLFFNGSKSAFKALVISGILATTISGMAHALFTITGTITLRAMPDIIFGSFMIVFSAWQFHATRRARARLNDFVVEPFLKKRYEFLSLASIVFIINGVMCMLPGLVERGILTVYIFITVSSLSLVYLFINVLVWLPPAWFKNLMNGVNPGGASGEAPQEHLPSEDELMAALAGG